MPDSLARPVVLSRGRALELAAWAFLFTIRDLYPDVFRELMEIAAPFVEDLHPEADEQEVAQIEEQIYDAVFA